jgi:hypothetical protein
MQPKKCSDICLKLFCLKEATFTILVEDADETVAA